MSYDIFASFYDIFTRDVQYPDRADYITGLLRSHGVENGILLDLACGTGSLSLELCKQGYDVIGVDKSPEMLTRAREKAAEDGQELLLLCQDMTNLDLYGTIRACVCSLDSINHLKSEKEVAACFRSVSLFTEKGGVFVFDFNTPYKHEHILGNNDFTFEEDGVFCAWHNEFDAKNCSVDIYLDFFKECENGQYERFSECFTERAFSTGTLERILREAGFTGIEFFSDMTDRSPAHEDERICCVAIKE